MGRRRHTAGVLVVCGMSAAAGALAGAPHAAGAAVTITDPSPPDGAVLPTQRSPYRVPLIWRADMTGCTSPTARAEVAIMSPDGLTTRGSIEGSPPSGGQSFVVTALRRQTYRWWVELTCESLGPVFSELRTFTLVGPNPQPRLDGRYAVSFSAAGVVEVWRFRARCPAGACNTIVTRPGAPAALLRYDRRRRLYRGTIRRVPTAAEAVCALPKGDDEVRNVPRTYRGLTVTVALRVALTTVDASGRQRQTQRLLGRSSGFYVPNARGRRLGCRAGRITTPVDVNRSGDRR